VLTLTIHPDDLMLAMIKLKLPYKSVLVTSLATRFVPTLVDDVERITDHVAILHQGSLLFDGAITDLCADQSAWSIDMRNGQTITAGHEGQLPELLRKHADQINQEIEHLIDYLKKHPKQYVKVDNPFRGDCESFPAESYEQVRTHIDRLRVLSNY